MDNKDLKIIKKKYGENMMHLCRRLFSTILEVKPGQLSELLLKKFDNNRFLYNDIVDNQLEEEFKNYIYSFFEIEKIIKVDVKETPEQLLKHVGYTLYECHNEEEIQSFKKYYSKGEELCTFRGGRLNRCHVFFAVKDNVNEIKRENFKKPQRQDEYGTSVISIQFTKTPSHTLSIKNRYNHTVVNPDATFSNDLDNIVPFLTESFEKYYGMKQKIKSNNFEIPKYVLASDGKFYKYNYEINNTYYCPNNIVIKNFEPKKYSERYIVMDNYVLDVVSKEILTYDYFGDELKEESFIKSIGKIKKVNQSKNKENRIITITPQEGEDIIIELDEQSRIIKYKNNNVEIIEDNFLMFNNKLQEFIASNVKEIENMFLVNSVGIENFETPKLRRIRNNALVNNRVLVNFYAPELQEAGSNFLKNNQISISFHAPKLQKVGHNANGKMIKLANQNTQSSNNSHKR